MDKQSKKEMIRAYLRRPVVGGVYAYRNNRTGELLVLSTPNLEGTKNQFDFSRQTESCVHMKLQDAWREYGAGAFELVVLEELKKKEDQTDREFRKDLEVLLELWKGKLEDESRRTGGEGKDGYCG
ncbi:GIY-YIG nuclease family protein [Papillibacter cinnamivorans]|nr:GIY-YIG nuclease family protein [Papillibacter cinnamivorans]